MDSSVKPFVSFRDKRRQVQPVPVVSRKRKIRFTRRVWVAIIIASVVIFAALILAFYQTASSVVSFVFSQGSSVTKDNGRVNVLLLGNGGGNHDGAELTDSIIVASFDPRTKQATLISVPRDIWLDSINEKVNAAYEIGQKQGNGLKFAEDKIDDILGIKVNYGVRIDFTGFSKAVDIVGGIDVNIINTFDDYEYPIEGKENDLCGYQEQEIDVSDTQSHDLNVPVGKRKVLIAPDGKVATDSATLTYPCRFEHLHFDKGLTHLDGVTALKFVRSRHGNNNEGSDFARSKRQQLVIDSFKAKALSVNTFTNPQTVFSLVNTFGQSFETDIPKEQWLDFYKMAKQVDKTDSIVLGDLGNGKSVLTNPPVSKYGAWVLIPPNNDYTQIKAIIHDTLEGTGSAMLMSPSPTSISTPKPK